MIDFIKLNVSYLTESELLNNPLIEWKQETNLNTGEMIYPIKGKYYNLDIKINPTRKEITGSIHKLRNELKMSQNQNFNDFTYDDLKEMIFHLNEIFNLVLNDTIIENLEIGLNINTDKTPERILNDNLIVWKFKTPTKNKEYNGKGKYIDFETSQYYFKIYDKGIQYDLPENILRIECKIIRNDFLNKFGIHHLNDLLCENHLKTLQNFLFETFTECVIVDDLSPETITEPKEREIFIKGINSKNWTSFQNRTTKKRFKDDFIQVVEKYSLNTIYKEIESKLRAKGKELLECNEMNDFQNVEIQSQNTEMLRIESYIYIQNVTQRKCKITGIDITQQKGESKFLSQASIKRIFETEPETFKTLLSNFSPKEPERMSFDKLCLEIAHNIRNRDSNKRHEIIRKTEFYRNSFFPLHINSIINNNILQHGI
jgi:hypothetical protein